MKLGFKIVLLIIALIAGKDLQAQNNLTYKQLIEEADLYLKAGDVGFARIDYEKAVTINPSDEYPRLKLAEIDRKENTQHRVDSLFEQSLINAEKYFKSGNYNLAQIEYKRSLELKPESVFIKERLAAISASVPKVEKPMQGSSLVNIKAETVKPGSTQEDKKTTSVKQEIISDKSSVKESNQSSVNTAVKKMDSEQPSAVPTPLQTALNQAEDFLNAKDYENAAQRYQAALTLKPGDKTIKSKLNTTLALLDRQKKEQKTYNDIILAAEKAVTQKNVQQAITYYEQAALIKSDDVAVMNILITLRDKLSVEQNLEKDFKEIIVKADNYFHDNKLTEAKKSYEQARTIKPDDKYPQEKLLEISKIEAITEAENIKKYKEILLLAESLLNQEDFQGAYETFSKASALQPREGYPKQKVAELSNKIKELESQYKIVYNGYIAEANKAFQAKNWDIAMDSYLKALRAKATDTLALNQISRIVGYMNNKLIVTLTPSPPSIPEGKEVKLPFKAIESAKKRNQYLLVRIKNSGAGTPRLYINYGQDTQKNGGILYRNLLKGGQYIDYVIRLSNQDRWYRLDNNWISLTVEGGSLEVENLKICADF